MGIEEVASGEDVVDAEEIDPELISLALSGDEKRSGLRSRTVEQLARDLSLARDKPLPGQPANSESLIESNEPADIGEIQGRRGRAIFLVGAGCSQSAGIPLAAEVAKRCARILALRYAPPRKEAPNYPDAKSALAALVERKVVPVHYVLSNGDGDWASLYNYFFADHLKSPNQQREVISAVIGDREFDLNWAHACLGALVQRRYVHTVLTTNFDQLVLQGIIRTGITPVVADGLESLTRISPSPVRPQVVHLHGSMHTYDLRNSPTALSETGDDPNFQTMMMSLLKQSTILVIVGYAGGEEGVMRLLQYAAQNIPRMVIYWVAYERSYADFSPRARKLLETGENKFFIPDKDADRFFQRLMRDLGEGQPDWVADPIQALVNQGKRMRSNEDYEIHALINDYRERTEHARKTRKDEDDVLIDALQAHCEGDFTTAAKMLEPIRDKTRRHHKLYALSLQNAYDLDPGANAEMIDIAVAEFRTLNSTARGDNRFDDVVSLVEALFDKLDAPEDDDTARNALLAEIGTVIRLVRERIPDLASPKRALLDFYEARALQEQKLAADGGAPDRSVIEAYRRAVTDVSALGDKGSEARDGLAQALVTFCDTLLQQGEPDQEARRQCRSDLSEAIAIHQELVELAWYNEHASNFAGALENLASDHEVFARLKRRGAYATAPLREAAKSLERAVAAYRASDQKDRVAVAEERLSAVRQRMRG
jgi:hypothetical protein